MKTAKKIMLATAAFFIVTFGLFSCKNSESTSQAPKTAAEARELAASRIWSETPDTVFLDYHWGMSEKEVKATTARHIRDKKLRKGPFIDDYYYTMTLPNVGDIVCKVNFDFNNDSLFVITLIKHWNQSRDVAFSDFIEDFSGILTDKGYDFFYEENNPLFNRPSHDFFKGNTSATFVDDWQNETLAFVNEYVAARVRRENAAKQEAEKQKALEENKRKSNITRNDF